MKTDKFTKIVETAIFGSYINRKFPLFLLFLIIPLLTTFFIIKIFLPSTTVDSSHNNPVSHGLAEFEHSQLADRKIVALNGDWEFYWHKFYTSNDIFKRKIFMPVPGDWSQKLKQYEKDFDGRGYATYRLKIILPLADKKYSILVPPVYNAYRVILNNKKIAEVGRVSQSKIESVPALRTKIYNLGQLSGENELIFHVSNHHLAFGGIRRPIYLGYQESIQQTYKNSRERKIFFTGAFFLIGIYHLGLFFIRNSKDTFYFAVLCFIGSLYMFLDQDVYIYNYTNSLSWQALYKIQFSIMYLAAIVVSLYTYFLFPRDFSSQLIRNFLLIVFGLLLITILFPPFWFTRAVYSFMVIIVVYLSLIARRLRRAVLKKRPGIRLFIFGGGIFAVSIINDLLNSRSIINTGYHSISGFFILVLVQAVLLSIRFNEAFTSSEKLIEKIYSLNKIYSKYVPREFLFFLKKESIGDVHLGDEASQEVTVLFSDIRNFTAISEKLPPKEIFAFLNQYFKTMNQIIARYNGVIDKYMGDAIMAIFPNNPDDAVRCAVEMQKIVKTTWFKIGNKEHRINVGIGIHFGEVLLGVVGGEKLMQTTVVSDVVNTASRLEGLTKKLGANIIISENLLEELDDPTEFHLRFLGYTQIKGRQEPIYICEVFNSDSKQQIELKTKTRQEFDNAMIIYQNSEYEKAWTLFLDLIKKNPKDKVAVHYMNETADFLVKGKMDLVSLRSKKVVWNDKWATGIPLIDQQHKVLFDIINELDKAIQFERAIKVIRRIFANLKLYVFTHFTVEEELMIEANYPDLVRHKIQHARFILKMEEIEKSLENENIQAPIEILDYLCQWLMEHVKKSDRDGYSPFLKQHSVDEEIRVIE